MSIVEMLNSNNIDDIDLAFGILRNKEKEYIKVKEVHNLINKEWILSSDPYELKRYVRRANNHLLYHLDISYLNKLDISYLNKFDFT